MGDARREAVAAAVEAVRARHRLDEPAVPIPAHPEASPARQWISQLHADRATLLREYEAVVEELEDGNEAYRAVMREACEGGVTYSTDDRLHCTCVPHLREGIQTLRAQHAALVAGLREIKNTQGKVCETYELCTHVACQSSYHSWSIADELLATLGGAEGV